MKISIVTAVFNREKTIGRCLRSFNLQSWTDKEHIIIDGGSNDNTMLEIGENSDPAAVVVSERDTGIYDALNKGILRSTGEIIGFLHSDDIFANNNVLADVAALFSDPEIDMVYADVEFFLEGSEEKVIRRYDSSKFRPEKIPYGIMPAHTTLFVRRDVYQKLGMYRTDYKIAADFEFVARAFWKSNLGYKYSPNVWVKMQSGGASTAGLRSKAQLNFEVLKACRQNNISTNLYKILSKYPSKILEFIRR